MASNFQPEARENKAYSVRIAELLDELIVTLKVKAGWLAHVLGWQDSVLSEMRRGTRRIPAGAVPDIDKYLGGHYLLEELASMEGCGVYTKEPQSLNAKDLEAYFILSLREEGSANAEIAQALIDGVIDPDERRAIYAKAVKMRRLWAEIEEGTRDSQAEATA
jgi:hypothetical protein